MRAAEGADGIHRDRHAERPARGDHDPTGVLAFGLIEHHVGDHAIAQRDQQHGAEQFCEKGWHRFEWEAAKLAVRQRLVYTLKSHGFAFFLLRSGSASFSAASSWRSAWRDSRPSAARPSRRGSSLAGLT